MKKRVLLLGVAVFLVACGNKNTAVSTTSTTTTTTTETTTTTTAAPIIKEVVYKKSENKNEYHITKLQAVNGRVSKMSITIGVAIDGWGGLDKKSKNRGLEIYKSNLEKDEHYLNLKALEGVTFDTRISAIGIDATIKFDLEKIDTDKFKQKMGMSVYEYVLDENGDNEYLIYATALPLSDAERILREQGAKKLEEN